MRVPKSDATSRGRPETSGGAGGERAAIERLRRRLPGPPPGQVWIGDDAAVLGERPGELVVTTDLTVAGVHGDLESMGLDDLGWRAVVRAVSDVAAMGATPDGAVVAVAGPPTTDLDSLYDGVAAAADAHGCPVVGGDLSGADQLVLAVAVTAHVDAPPGPVLRSGARPGHRLVVSGPLGGGAAGLRSLRAATGDSSTAAAYLRPRARLAEGDTARRAGAVAMIDVSDGLLLDLDRLAEASGVGFALDDVPVYPGATVDDALGGGDDYELVVAVTDVENLASAFAAAGLRPPIDIGVCTDDVALRTVAGERVEPAGWEHRWT
jgi:thiamine-monophosphate kinase